MTSSYLVRRLARQRSLRAPRGVASGCTHGVGSQVMRVWRALATNWRRAGCTSCSVKAWFSPRPSSFPGWPYGRDRSG